MSDIIVTIVIILVVSMIILSIIPSKYFDRITLHRIYTGLRAIGLDAQKVERGRPEEHIGEDSKGKSQGLIEIQDGPIRRVNVLKEKGTGGEHGPPDTYTNVYLVPSPTGYVKTYGEIKSIRKKSVPLIGRVVDIRWEANFEGDLIRKISEDVSLNENLIKLNEDVTIRGFPEYGCWGIVSRRYPTSWFGLPCRQRAPSRVQWDSVSRKQPEC